MPQVAAASGERKFDQQHHRQRDGHPALSPLQAGFQARMRDALLAFSGPVLLIMSGRDYTANEFDSWLAQPAQCSVRERQHCQRVDLPEADHTFASSSASLAVSNATSSWLRRLERS